MEANQASLDFAGIAKEDVIGKALLGCPVVAGQRGPRAAIENRLLHGRPKGSSCVMRSSCRGREIPGAIIDFSLKPVFGPDGKVNDAHS